MNTLEALYVTLVWSSLAIAVLGVSSCFALFRLRAYLNFSIALWLATGAVCVVAHWGLGVIPNDELFFTFFGHAFLVLSILVIYKKLQFINEDEYLECLSREQLRTPPKDWGGAP